MNLSSPLARLFQSPRVDDKLRLDDGSAQRLLSAESARAARLERLVTTLEESLRRKTAEAAHHAQQRNVIHSQVLALGQNALKPLGAESTPDKKFSRLQNEVVNATALSSASAARAQVSPGQMVDTSLRSHALRVASRRAPQHTMQLDVPLLTTRLALAQGLERELEGARSVIQMLQFQLQQRQPGSPRRPRTPSTNNPVERVEHQLRQCEADRDM